jgi:hypothetical protein
MQTFRQGRMTGHHEEVFMHKTAKQSMVLLLVLALTVVPFGSAALAQVEFEVKEPSFGAMTYDLFVLRPFGGVATIVGAGVFVIALPFTAITGTVGLAGKKMVAEPFNFTITRPLGNWKR